MHTIAEIEWSRLSGAAACGLTYNYRAMVVFERNQEVFAGGAAHFIDKEVEFALICVLFWVGRSTLGKQVGMFSQHTAKLE